MSVGKQGIRQIVFADINEQNLHEFIPRNVSSLEDIKDNVLEIINSVKTEGDIAIQQYTEQFDAVSIELNQIQVEEAEIEESYEVIDKNLLHALQFAKKNLIKFHQAQLRKDWSVKIIEGVTAGQIFRPIESVGIYVPGGRAIYPSTVLMTAAPAYVAGVKECIICSPPQKNGRIAPEILVAAREFDITKIFKVGGVQAIAAMAFGTETIPKVLKVVGPGNKWVNAAKQLLSYIIAIDNPAGPSEILIIADNSADYKKVLLDFISQIEHDPDNVGIIATTSSELIRNIQQNIDNFIVNAQRKEIIQLALRNTLLIKCNSLQECISLSNMIAPEHLEILTQNPRSLLEGINNAGAIFLGENTPVPLGDYSAGTNHVLPTGGYAKTYSGLNAYDFLKVIDVLECSSLGLKKLSESAMRLASFEKLFAHREAIMKRLLELEEDK
ncbi:MAG: bifunctional histidinal dehydrogenase and histidinol dehydrogenase [Promethearchaeota archaeon]|nr:MAG: bifunctional histidinal dehydrogenase and histidinol dehydrogenase [Candidatus Lokiarchaeota archaeon]